VPVTPDDPKDPDTPINPDGSNDPNTPNSDTPGASNVPEKSDTTVISDLPKQVITSDESDNVSDPNVSVATNEKNSYSAENSDSVKQNRLPQTDESKNTTESTLGVIGLLMSILGLFGLGKKRRH
ncbi:LPXTG cell wall anchor domain-containing protein, partial [Pediococcus acidilactici]